MNPAAEMNCPLLSEETGDVLLDYSAGRLDKPRTLLLERHMGICPDCAAFRMEQAELWNVLDAWEPEPVSLDFNRRLWRRIESLAAAPWHRRLIDALRLGAWKPAFPLAAAVVVVVAGFMMDHQSTITQSQGVAGASGVSVNEADQIERTLDDIQLLRQFNAVPGSGATSSKSM